MHPTDNQNGLAVIESLWPRLRDADRLALTTLALSASGTSCPVAPRRRHRHYTDGNITELRAQIIAILSRSPSLPNKLVAAELNIPYSTFKSLRLNHFARQALAASAAPHSAVSANYRNFGERADRGDSGGED